jgi:hypothetical protein
LWPEEGRIAKGFFDICPRFRYQRPMRVKSIPAAVSCLFLVFLGQGVAAEAPATFKVGEFTFARPADWQWQESASMMRKAQLKLVSADKKQTGEVVFFHFGEGNGGGTKANIDRWLGQFEEPKEKLNSKVEELTVNKHKVSYVQAQGTYQSGMPGGPKTPQPNTMLLGAIIESEQGSVFIKLTAPLELAKSSQTTFRKRVEGALGGGSK